MQELQSSRVTVPRPGQRLVDLSRFQGADFRRAILMENCGWFAVINHPEAAYPAVKLLHGVTNRGQTGGGLADEHGVIRREGEPIRSFGFPDHQDRKLAALYERTAAEIRGTTVIGHTRLPTHGGGGIENLQPLEAEIVAAGKPIKVQVALNGTFANAEAIRAEQGFPAKPDTDTVVLLHLMKAMPEALTVREKLISALNRIMDQGRYGREFGGFAGVLRAGDETFLFRDPFGARPAAFGLLPVLGRRTPAVVAASESGALREVGTRAEWEVLPGELLQVTKDGKILSESPFAVKGNRAFCIFEIAYLARPDSRLPEMNMQQSFWDVRKRLGSALASKVQGMGIELDKISYFPKSAEPQWRGFIEKWGAASGLELYLRTMSGRSFLGGTPQAQASLARRKLRYISGQVDGQRLGIVDDTLMRGTTTRARAEELRSGGVKELTLLIPFPLTPSGCPKGVNFPDPSSLLAHRFPGDYQRIAQEIGFDRVITLTIDEALKAIHPGLDLDNAPFCTQCVTGAHPAERKRPGEVPGFSPRGTPWRPLLKGQ